MRNRNNNCGCNGNMPAPPEMSNDGLTPFIGKNGNWWIGLSDTGVKAYGTNGTNGIDGINGTNGITPTIGNNGNWFIGTTDTGVKAEGTSATVSVGTTTTLPAGSQATVTNTGTPSAAIFNFGIPQGGASGGCVNEYASIFGVLLNDANNPSLVGSGKRIPWKSLTNNETLLLKPSALNDYFQFTKLGRYLCVFSLRCATTVSGDNNVVNWGLFAQSIQKEMVTSASAFVTPNMTDISGVGIFDVVDLNEQYNLINNSLIAIKAQGTQSTQVFTNKFVDVNGVNMVDGMSVVFIRLGDNPEKVTPVKLSTTKLKK